MGRTYEQGYNQALKDYETNKDIEELRMIHAWSQTGFWYHNPKMPPMLSDPTSKNNDYKFITTRYDKGYFKALEDIEKKEQEEHPLQKRIDDFLGGLNERRTKSKR